MIEQIVDQYSFLWELLIFCLLFASVFPRRNLFWPRLLCCAIVGHVLCAVLPLQFTVPATFSLIQAMLFGAMYPRYLILFIFCFLCVLMLLRVTYMEALFIAASGYCGQHLVYKLYDCLREMFAYLFSDSMTVHLLYGVTRFIITYGAFALYWFFYIHPLKSLGSFKIHNRYMTFLSVIVITVTNVLNGLFYSLYYIYPDASMKPLFLVLYTAFPVLLCLLCLIGLLDGTYRETLNENYIKSQALHEKLREQYRTSKRNADTINIKYHDLKRFLENSSFSTNIAEDIRQAVEQYEALPKTQNNALNIVLAEKLSEMEAAGIEFRSNIYAEPLSALSGTDVYAFFSNLLSNSIEHLKSSLTDEKYIALDILKCGDMLKIRAENPLSGAVTVDRETGLPETTKCDKENHGFGVQSMRQVMQKYGGNLVFDTRGGRFIVIGLLPIR